MTVAFRSAATAVTTSGTDGTGVTITKPTGTASGDTMVCVLGGPNPTSGNPSTPAGWLLLGKASDGTGLYSWVYQKIAGASEASSYAFTWAGTNGAITGSITSFSGGNGIEQLSGDTTSTTDPSVGVDITPQYPAMRYDVYAWRDTTSDTVTWSIGTKPFDVVTKDSGTIWRGQSAAYSNIVNAAGVPIIANTANPTNSIDFGIHWSMSIASTPPAAESWSSSGFGLEMQLGSTWTELKDYIREGTGINVTRGKSGQGGDVNPSECTFSLENKDGRFTPRNPMGAYYGSIGRNTPVRVWKALGGVSMHTTGQDSDRFQTTGAWVPQGTDMDIRVDCEPKAWQQNQVLAAQGSGTFQSSLTRWVFYIGKNGFLVLDCGTALFNAGFVSTARVPAATRQAVRVTYDADNGSGGATCTFYTGSSVTGSWTQLGLPVTIAGTQPIGHTRGYALTVGGLSPSDITTRRFNPANHAFMGKIYAMAMYSGIAGTLIANADFTAQTTGTYSFVDSVNAVWTAYGNAVCTNRYYRYHGEVSSWSPRWDVSGNDVWTEVQCGGLLRRIGQGASPLKSGTFRYYTNPDGVFQNPPAPPGYVGAFYSKYYWPMEDGANSTYFSSGLPNGKAGQIIGLPELANYSGLTSSDPVPHWVTGSSGRFSTPGFTSGAFTVEFQMSAPSGALHGATIVRINVTGGTYYDLIYADTNTLRLQRTTVTDSGSSTAITDALVFPIAGDLDKVYISSDGVNVLPGVFVGSTRQLFTYDNAGGRVPDVGNNVTSVWINPNQDMNDVYIGHLAVFDGTKDSLSGTKFYDPLRAGLNTPIPNLGYIESGPVRATRLIREQGYTPYIIGASSSYLGAQTSQTFPSLLEECEETDLGTLYEPRDLLGLGYRSRRSMYGQAARLTLNYTGAMISGDLQPDEDDTATRNDITVTRIGGTASRVVDSTSAMGTAAPPAGVGLYDEGVEVSLWQDDQAIQNASWRVHLGTVNELHYPSIQTEFANSGVAASASTQLAILDADIADRLVITNQPTTVLPTDQITQLIMGYGEYIDSFNHKFTFYTQPESPYDVAIVGVDRVDSLGSTTNGTMTTTATSMSVKIASGHARWTTSVGSGFDVLVGGERMTVTAISGTSSPQTFTVTRSVNGVVKTHAVGESVRLMNTPFVALNS